MEILAVLLTFPACLTPITLIPVLWTCALMSVPGGQLSRTQTETHCKKTFPVLRIPPRSVYPAGTALYSTPSFLWL